MVSGSNWGAVIYASTSSVTINNCVFEGNSVPTSFASRGGVLYVNTYTTISVSNSQFTNNHAGDGGVLYASFSSGSTPSYVFFSNCLFEGNYASGTTTTGFVSSVIRFTSAGTQAIGVGLTRTTFVNNYCSDSNSAKNCGIIQLASSAPSSVIRLGIASSSISSSDNRALRFLVLSGSAGTISLFPFNTCAVSIKNYNFVGAYSIYDSSTEPFVGPSAFCSQCSSVLVNNQFCNSLSSTINCALQTSSEPVSPCSSSQCPFPLLSKDSTCTEFCPASTSYYGAAKAQLCVLPENCPDSFPYPNTASGFCTKCPIDTYFHPVLQECVQVSECPFFAPFGDPSTGYCVRAAAATLLSHSSNNDSLISGGGCSASLPWVDTISKLCVYTCSSSHYPDVSTNRCLPCSTSVFCDYCVFSWTELTRAVAASQSGVYMAICLRRDLVKPSGGSTISVSGKTLGFFGGISSSANTVISSAQLARLFSISNTGTITFSKITFKNFAGTSDGSVASIAGPSTDQRSLNVDFSE